jgi:hypothetical protein
MEKTNGIKKSKSTPKKQPLLYPNEHEHETEHSLLLIIDYKLTSSCPPRLPLPVRY